MYPFSVNAALGGFQLVASCIKLLQSFLYVFFSEHKPRSAQARLQGPLQTNSFQCVVLFYMPGFSHLGSKASFYDSFTGQLVKGQGLRCSGNKKKGVNSLPGTTITNHHKLVGLKQHKSILSQFQRPEVKNQYQWAEIKASRATPPLKGLGEDPFLASSSFWCSLVCGHITLTSVSS